MSNILENFKNHAESGIVPIKLREGVEKQNFPFSYKDYVPKNCFYESLDHVGSVLLPAKQTMCGIAGISAIALTNIVLQPLCLAFAYLSYWPAKLVSNKTEGRLILKRDTESLVDYSSVLSCKASDYSRKVGKFVNTVLNYAFTFVIWTVALIPTPAVLAGKKVASKLGKTQPPEPAKSANGQATEEGAFPTRS